MLQIASRSTRLDPTDLFDWPHNREWSIWLHCIQESVGWIRSKMYFFIEILLIFCIQVALELDWPRNSTVAPSLVSFASSIWTFFLLVLVSTSYIDGFSSCFPESIYRIERLCVDGHHKTVQIPPVALQSVIDNYCLILKFFTCEVSAYSSAHSIVVINNRKQLHYLVILLARKQDRINLSQFDVNGN